MADDCSSFRGAMTVRRSPNCVDPGFNAAPDDNSGPLPSGAVPAAFRFHFRGGRVKGIILAGGRGTRLHPLTLATCKQLLPIYDKPMIYYPLSVLMLAGVREILVISTPEALEPIENLLGDGGRFGIELSYAVQDEPNGIAEALIIGESHIKGDDCMLILGDNLFYGAGLYDILHTAISGLRGCALFGYPVTDPERYAVGVIGADGRLESIEEKPVEPLSDNAITGLYLYDENAADIARGIRPSARGELEITDVNRVYLENGTADFHSLGRGFAWLDAGTREALLEASQYVRTLEQRQGVSVSCPEEIALRMGFIDSAACLEMGARMGNSEYGKYVVSIARYWNDVAEG